MIVTLVVRSQTITLTIGALNTSGGGGGGVSIHNDLTGRSTTDAHPIAAITGLQAALDAKSATSHTHTGTYEPANANLQAHIGNTSNPHSVTAAQVGADATGTAAAAVMAHAGATDPHGDRAFATSAVSTHAALTTGVHGLGGASQLNVGTTAGTVAAGDHAHTGVYQPLATVLTNTTAAFTTAQETKLSGIEAAADVTDAGNVGAAIDGATAKTTPVDADTVALIDSAAGNVLKKLSWANIKATAKAYFDTLYQAASATLTTWAGITPGTGIATALGTNVGTAGAPVINGGALGTPSSGNLGSCTFPTLNQNTSGYAESLKSATTTVSVSAATAPSSGQVLTATSSTAATWQTPAGGAGTDTFLVRGPLDNEPPASAFATLDTRNSIPCLDFDAAADESAIFSGFAPEAIVLTSGIIARIVWAATSATSGNVRWRVKFERRTTDQDSDSWDTATEATDATNGTSGICETCEITCTTIDSIVAGDSFRVCVTRVGTDGTNDTMTGDAELFGFELRAAGQPTDGGTAEMTWGDGTAVESGDNTPFDWSAP